MIPSMLWIRMLLIATRLAWPYLFTPWRSPLLRWRIEAYGLQDASGRMLHADEVTTSHVVRFVIHRRAALWRFLRWAALL